MGEPQSPADIAAGIAFAERIFEEIEGDEFTDFTGTYIGMDRAFRDKYQPLYETFAWLLAATVLEQQKRNALLERLLGEACDLAMNERWTSQPVEYRAEMVRRIHEIRAELAGKERGE